MFILYLDHIFFIQTLTKEIAEETTELELTVNSLRQMY